MGEELVQPSIPDLPEDIIGPSGIVPLFRLILIGLTLVVIGFIAFRVWIRFRRKVRKKATLDPVVAARTAISSLYHRLPELSAKEVAVELPRILKAYLRGRYGVDLLSSTTSELWSVRDQWESKLPAGFGEYLAQFFDQCDAVKFDSTSLADETKQLLFEAALFGDLAPDETWSPWGKSQGAVVR